MNTKNNITILAIAALACLSGCASAPKAKTPCTFTATSTANARGVVIEEFQNKEWLLQSDTNNTFTFRKGFNKSLIGSGQEGTGYDKLYVVTVSIRENNGTFTVVQTQKPTRSDYGTDGVSDLLSDVNIDDVLAAIHARSAAAK